MTEIQKKPMTRKRRFGLVLLFMAFFSVSYQIGSFVKVSPEDAKLLMDQFGAISENIDAIGIFAHNMTLNGLMFIPGFGIVWGFIASFQTGMAYSAFATLEPALQNFPALGVLYLSPFGLMELFAYGIAMSRSFLITKKLIKRDESLKKDLKPILIEVAIVVGLLLAGGFLEMYMIEWATQSGFDMTEMLK